MKKIFVVCFLLCTLLNVAAQENVIDEVVWVVGDESILLSDIEERRLVMQSQGRRFDGDPYCIIPEQLAIQKLYLNQAKLDSVEVGETTVIQQLDGRMNYYLNELGSREKLEEYFNKKYSEIRELQKEQIKEDMVVQRMQQQLVGEIKLTPADIRQFYNQIPKDSLPNIATTAEVQIITYEPKIPLEETDAIKARLRDFTEQINSGKMTFSSLARLYSEDKESAIRGGELGSQSRTSFLPEFANMAFSLNDNKRVSNIVESEYGFHIIQLIEKRGDRINCRHILLRPKVSEQALNEAMIRMDSLYTDLTSGKFTFEEAATYVSFDKNTRNNKGIMVNQNYESNYANTPKFELGELPQEIGKVVYDMKIGEVSKPFRMINDRQKEIVAIVKLRGKTEAHKANVSDDYQILKSMVEERKREQMLKDWIAKKQKNTYIRISERCRNCDFQFPGWIKQ